MVVAKMPDRIAIASAQFARITNQKCLLRGASKQRLALCALLLLVHFGAVIWPETSASSQQVEWAKEAAYTGKFRCGELVVGAFTFTFVLAFAFALVFAFTFSFAFAATFVFALSQFALEQPTGYCSTPFFARRKGQSRQLRGAA